MGRIITLFRRFSRESREDRQRKEVIERYLEAARAARSAIISYCFCPCGEIEKLFINLVYWTKFFVHAGFCEIPFAAIVQIGDTSTDLQPLRNLVELRRLTPIPAVLEIEAFYQRKFSQRSPAILQQKFLEYLRSVLPVEQFAQMFPDHSHGGAPDPRDRPLPIAG